MSASRQSFHVGLLYGALEDARAARNLDWRGVGREAGVVPSTFSRMAQGRHPNVNTLVRLVTWLGVPAETFFQNEEGNPPGRDDDLSAFAKVAAHIRTSNLPQTTKAIMLAVLSAAQRLETT